MNEVESIISIGRIRRFFSWLNDEFFFQPNQWPLAGVLLEGIRFKFALIFHSTMSGTVNISDE